MNVKELAELAERRQLSEEHSRQELLDHLRKLDPELAARVVYVFDDKSHAALWLTKSTIILDNITPLQALAEGNREDVLRVLNGILYGLPG